MRPRNFVQSGRVIRRSRMSMNLVTRINPRHAPSQHLLNLTICRAQSLLIARGAIQMHLSCLWQMLLHNSGTMRDMRRDKRAQVTDPRPLLPITTWAITASRMRLDPPMSILPKFTIIRQCHPDTLLLRHSTLNLLSSLLILPQFLVHKCRAVIMRLQNLPITGRTLMVA